ncbi:hypothetical protein ES703_95733 [subsurface metagenome]
MVPILAGAGKTRHLNTQNDTYMVECDFRDDPLEPEPSFGRGAGLTKIVIDYDYTLFRPTQFLSSQLEVVLNLGGLLVTNQLLRSRLSYVHHRQSFKVPISDLLRVQS